MLLDIWKHMEYILFATAEVIGRIRKGILYPQSTIAGSLKALNFRTKPIANWKESVTQGEEVKDCLLHST